MQNYYKNGKNAESDNFLREYFPEHSEVGNSQKRTATEQIKG